MATQDKQETDKIEALETEIKSLKDNLSEITTLIKEIGEGESKRLSRKASKALNQASTKAENLLEDFEEEGEDIYHYLKEKLATASSQAERKAKDNPLITVGLVAGISLVVGYLFNNKR
ncbi:DUF883 C-terminal domain-containing protein [Otariodibacter sp.]|uniref:DUF883 family protein n=1 Tax=Otariodibacter sp. TaxID=3030919 RepID=UPI0026177A71|nr:DUF883 C-terminal domain-containing protein [Otariodibacter sp.]